ncbi:MAG: hypothetical protein R8P61_00940 [Bacteroidia bacterium]|nr:hypothetical protein [Bacteroidia bacterium]
MKNIYKTYIVPGLLFQSIVVGGGYGTGREIIEFFMSKGPLGGYLGILVSMVIWSIIIAIGFELARRYKLYDYRSFLKNLLGKGWMLFELVYIANLVIAVAVVGSASGELLFEMTGWSKMVGTLLMVTVVGYLVFKGSKLIEKALSTWSLVLYAAYLILIIAAVYKYGGTIAEQMGVSKPDAPWLTGGFQYAAYNLAALPAILFIAGNFKNRKEAMTAGLLAGPLAMLPAIFIYTSMLAFYPGILTEAIPANFLIGQLDWPIFQLIFQLILFGTFIETGTGMIHGYNERVAGVYKERGEEMPAYMRLAIGVVILILAIFFADLVGLIDLISKGYGYLTWAFWIVFLLPLLILGSLRIFGKNE